jgi:hypothetical protein
MIKDFFGGAIGCALPAFSHKPLHLFPQLRELFPVIPAGQDDVPMRKGELQLADVQAKTKELFEAELAKLN